MSENQEDKNRQKGATGRTQLKGVLDGLVQQSKEERDELIVVDDDVEEGARDLMELPNRGSGGGVDDGTHRLRKSSRMKLRTSSSPMKRRRKRQRKDYLPSPEGSDSNHNQDEERHIPHVMTLFDRKVDLAWFTPTTSLYVMCREWMCNNPEKLGGDPAHNAPPTFNHLPAPEEQTRDMEENSFPGPVPLPMDESGAAIRLDIPQPLPPHGSMQELREDLRTAMDREREGEATAEVIEAYKEQHVTRWREVRSRWKQASAANQRRYADSLGVLREMYQR